MAEQRLPWDCTRCEGKYCQIKEKCLLHEQLSNMGPRTPVTDFSLPERGGSNWNDWRDCQRFVEVGNG